MRKIALLFLLLIFAALPVRAIDLKVGPQSSALYYSADTVFYVAFRTDEAFLDTLENLLRTVSDRLPMDTPFRGLRELLGEGFGDDGIDFDRLMGWVGDYGAIGFSSFNVGGMGGNGYLTLELEDQAGAMAYLDERGDEYVKTSENDFTVYSRTNEKTGQTMVWAFGDGIVLVSDANEFTLPSFPLSNSLRDSNDFLDTVGQLPVDDYNAVVYADVPVLTEGDPSAAVTAELFGKIAAGFTILNDDTLVMDLAQAPRDAATPQPVNTDFSQYIPENMSAFIHTRDLTGLLTNLTNLLAIQGSGDGMDQLSDALQQLGINLEQDLLSWTTGEYVLLMRSDLTGALTDFRENGSFDPLEKFDLAIVAEATDPVKAQVFAGKLNTLFAALSGAQPDLEVSNETISGTEVVVLSAPLDLGGGLEPGTVDIVIGANDDIFIVGTRGAVEAVLQGDGTVTANDAYQAASAYFLPNPTSMWFADREGLATSLLIPSAFIFGVSSNMAMPTSSTSMNVAYRQQDDDTTVFLRLIELFEGGSITAAVSENGAILTRFAITLNLE